MKYLAEIVKKSIEKDSIGNVVKGSVAYTNDKNIRIYDITPYSSANASKEYGFDTVTTHRTSTFDGVEVNSYLRYENNVYRIKEVVKYPRYFVLIMELMK